MTRHILALLLFITPAMAADITGIPRIVDGDTVQIDATKIRLSGIDAPETDQVCLDPAGEKWACLRRLPTGAVQGSTTSDG